MVKRGSSIVRILFLIYSVIACSEYSTARNGVLEIQSYTIERVKIPSAKRIVQDIVGCTFQERSENGYFKDVKWKIYPEDRVDVSIIDVKEKGGIFHYNIKMTITLPSEGCYIMSARIGYVVRNGVWKQDYFVCDKILPKETGLYTDFISTELTGFRGDRSLIIKNYSNIKLVVLCAIRLEYSNEYKNIAITIAPNEERAIGGLFLGSIDEYEIHYVERR